MSSVLGWAFELAVRGSSDVAVHGKYNLAGFLQVRHSLGCVCVCVESVCSTIIKLLSLAGCVFGTRQLCHLYYRETHTR